MLIMALLLQRNLRKRVRLDFFALSLSVSIVAALI